MGYNITYNNGRHLLSQLDLDNKNNEEYRNKIKYGNEQLKLLYDSQNDIKLSRDVISNQEVSVEKGSKKVDTSSSNKNKQIDNSKTTETVLSKTTSSLEIVTTKVNNEQINKNDKINNQPSSEKDSRKK